MDELGSSAAFRRPATIQRKLVVLGDGACGKTSLLTVFVKNAFSFVYEPTVFENYVKDVKVDNATVEMSLWDTAGQEDFDRLRTLTYSDTDCILLCFSVDNPISLENVESRWAEEIQLYLPKASLCLIACKCDLRDDPATIQKLRAKGQTPISYEQGLAVAKRMRANRYLECSAKANRGIAEAFEEAARVCIGSKRTWHSDRGPGSCCQIS